MKINRQNYEHWFIDFIEGNLTPENEAMVCKFALLNPDLSSELDDILEFKVTPEQKSFPNKNLLKQNSLNAIEGLTKFEQLSIAYLEKEISDDEQKELNHFLNNSDKKKKEFELIQKTKLIADNSIIYQSKNSLKKLFIVNKRIVNYKLIYRVAALFILLLGLTFLFNKNLELGLSGKKLAKSNKAYKSKRTIIIKETGTIQFENKNALITSVNKKEIEKSKDTEVLIDKLMAIECNTVSNNKSYNTSIHFDEHFYNNTLALNNKAEQKKLFFNKKALNKLKLTGKYLITKASKTFKKKFKYEKTFTDDGRTLIALKAGDFEYKISKKQKKNSAKELK